MTIRTIQRWLFADADGHIVIFQSPNAVLLIWAAFSLLHRFLFHASIFSWIARAALIVWALMEIFAGQSRFRRLLGLLILIGVVFSSV